MNNSYSSIARRYAQAFFNIAGVSWSHDDIAEIAKVRDFLEKNKGLLFFFTMPLIHKTVLDRVLKTLFKECIAIDLLQKLTLLLVKHKRAFLLPRVLFYIEHLFQQKECCMSFSIKSSHELYQNDLDVLVEFLKKKTDKNINYKHEIDTSLVAGIRLQSSTLVWEYSVKKQLRELNQKLVDIGEE